MTQEINPVDLEFSTVQEYAVLVEKSPNTIYTDICTERVPLPEIYRETPHSRPLFVNAKKWLADQVKNARYQRIAEHSLVQATSSDPTHLNPLQVALPLRKRGRPSNLQLQAAKCQAGSGKKGGVLC